MSIPELQLANFQSLFTGNTKNYGQHTYQFTNKEGEKEEGISKTIKDKLVTKTQYQLHLEGKQGLGIIPINEHNKCSFAVLDIDVYDVDLNIYIKAIERNNFPLVPFRSKSGGLHIYLFLKQAIDCVKAIELIKNMAGYLALDLLVKRKSNKMIEIFPKQTRLNDNSIGSWINLPYFNSDKTKQYAIKNGQSLTLEQAIMYAKEKRTTYADTSTFIKELIYQDAPPCLQSIALLDAPEKDSARNDYLFSFGVYLKKKNENFFEQALFDINNSLAKPLPTEELERTILLSLRKKDYVYKCNTSPCVDFCKKQECSKREFGVGKEDGYFSELIYGKLTQIKTAQPYYEWEIKKEDNDEFKLLRFKNEDEIIKQDAFLRSCFRELHLLPMKLKQIAWFKLVNQHLMEIEVKIVEQEDDTSTIGLFRNLFSEFILDRAMAQNKDQIFAKRVYYDKTQALYFFRAKDLMEYLFITKGFHYFNPTEIHGILNDMGSLPRRIKTETNKQLRVYAISTDKLNSYELEEREKFEPTFDTDDKDF